MQKGGWSVPRAPVQLPNSLSHPGPSLQMIIDSYQNIISLDAVNTGGHAVDTLICL